MRPSQEAALAALTDRLAPVPFLVGGSALAALHGADIAVGDIDLTTPAGSLEDLRRAAGDWWRGRRRGGGLPHLESTWLVGLELEGEKVDVMGGLAVIVGDVRWEMPLRFGGFAEVRGRPVPLGPLGPWVVLYSLYRPSTATALLPFLDRAEAERTRSEVPFPLEVDPASWMSTIAGLGSP
jgi:hypothetical protein